LLITTGADIVGDSGDFSTHAKHEKKMILHVLREMWLSGDSSLRRIYSSWEELERNLEIKSEAASRDKHSVKPCPCCGVRQRVRVPFEGVFPYQTCESCKQAFYVNKDLTVRKLTEEEKRELPTSWIQVVEDMNRQRVAVVFRLE
jgi:hypothetical protein